jgi:hypothetical protein
MYLGMTRPWSSGEPAAVAAIEAAPTDAGAPRSGKRRCRAAPRGEAPVREVDDAIVLGDADRRLEWRGDAVALPPKSVDMSAGDDARPLDAGEIQRTLERGSGPLLECVVRAAGEAPLEGTVTLEMLVDGGGRVVKSRVRAAAYLFAHGLQACVRRAAGQLSFPATGAHTVVTQPFELY